MIARIMKNWYARDKRVPGLPRGCIDCCQELGIACIELEARPLFECATARHLHKQLIAALEQSEVHKCEALPADEKLKVVVSTPNLDLWRVLAR